MKPDCKTSRYRHVALTMTFITSSDLCWSATNPQGGFGSLEAASLGILLVAIVFLVLRLRKTQARLDRQADKALVLTQELETSRATLAMSVRRQQQEREHLQAQLREEMARRETAQRLALQSAQQDVLTQLPNRARLQEDLAKALASAERRNSKLAVMFADLDDFKRINDTLGHSIGDELLRQAAARLSACVRGEDDVAINRDGHASGTASGHWTADTDSVARVGGDEFVLLFRDVADENALTALAKRLIDAFRTPFTIAGHKVQTCISLGIACYPRDGQYADTLLEHADMAMYRAKEKGKDGFEFFSHAMSIAASRRLAVESGLRQALDEEQFVVHYQPKVEAGSYRVLGVEALVRWRSPAHGLVGPGHFIEIAEEAGLIARIGEWVLMHACRQQRAWQDAGLPAIQMAVNVSSMQFREDHLLAAVVTAIKQSGIAPTCLQLEVTENLFMKNMNVARNTLEYIRGLGTTVAIDDFGTGYSSFGYLRQLPVDSVKIDRSFVQFLGTKADDREIIRAIISLARALGVKTVAEGVETKQQSDLLTELGCDEMQGFLFAPPVDADLMGRILKAGALPPDALPSIVHLPMANSLDAHCSSETDTSAFEFHAEETIVAPLWIRNE